MKCNLKSTLWTLAILVGGAGLAYFAFPGARTAIGASLPFLAFLLCPISMFLMMGAMHSSGKEAPAGAAKSEAGETEHGLREKLSQSR